MSAADRLAGLLESVPARLSAIADDEAAQPLAPGRWSRKQVLGHLIDSAGNNHQRIVRAQISPALDFPNYQQDAWVSVQAYASESWSDLVALWLQFNRHLLHIVRAVPEQDLSRPCAIGGKPAMPLSEVIDGYVDHLEHHLLSL